MLRALRVELAKLARQRLTLVGPAVLAVLVGLFAWGMWRHPLTPPQLGAGGGEILVAGKITTAPLLSYMLLRVPVAINLLIPLLIAVVTGGLVAGERHLGTLRTLLVRPVSRLGLLGAKLLTAWLHAAALTLFLGLFALLLGYAVFGPGDLLPLLADGFGLNILPHAEALQRLALGWGLAALAMTAVASVGMLLSVGCDNPLTAAGLTVAFLFVSGALQVIPYFDAWKPYLLTTYLDVGTYAFARPLDGGKILDALTGLLAWSAAAAALALWIFQRRDVRC